MMTTKLTISILISFKNNKINIYSLNNTYIIKHILLSDTIYYILYLKTLLTLVNGPNSMVHVT